MNREISTVQKATDLVAQYENFLIALKERAASFSSLTATVGCNVEKDFEILHAALEQRKGLLLSEMQGVSMPKADINLLELEEKQRKMRTLLQQLQQLAIQGSLSEDTECYRELLKELSEAKQKLKDTSDKYD